jgi:ABC-type sugar transport system ATPase subunit
MTMPTIEVRDVSKSYGGVIANKAVSLTMEPGKSPA